MSALITNSTGQIQMDFSVVTTGHTADVQALSVTPGVNGARQVKGQLYVDLGGLTPIRLDFTLNYHDVAFEEFDVFGSRMTAQSRARQILRY